MPLPPVVLTPSITNWVLVIASSQASHVSPLPATPQARDTVLGQPTVSKLGPNEATKSFLFQGEGSSSSGPGVPDSPGSRRSEAPTRKAGVQAGGPSGRRPLCASWTLDPGVRPTPTGSDRTTQGESGAGG